MRAAVAVVAVVLGLGGCGPAADEDRTLTVLAAASLTESFAMIARDFEAEHDGVTVRLGLGGSADLVSQLVGGAPADVLATADESTMQLAVDADLAAGEPTVFATNELRIVVPAENPGDVDSLADLEDPEVLVVVCAPQVPCGAAAARVEAAAGLDVRPVSEEQSVTAVLGKVLAGEADAGLVYATDVQTAGKAVRGIAFPEAADAVNRYPIVVLRDTERSALAEAFVAFVTGERGRRILADAGFGLP